MCIRSFLSTALLVASLLGVAGCGGGGSSAPPPPPTYTVSGNAGVASALITYTGGTTTAASTGTFSFTVTSGASGTITPTLTGYSFAPVSRTYTSVTSDQPGQTFTATAITYTISGALGAAGAGTTLSYTDGTAKTATADGSGNYSFAVSYNWSGTVTPTKVGVTFSPANKAFTNVLANQVQNFTATPITFTISGAAGAGTTLAYTDGTAKTATADGSGNYSFAVSYSWSGTVTPSKTGFTFSPASQAFTSVLANQVQNFTATAIIPIISGTLGATGAGATLAYTGGTTAADSSGNYSFTVSYNWSGTVTPSKTGFTFSPVSQAFTNVLVNQVQNFTPTAITYTISGALGATGAGATLSYTDGTAKTATADGSGNYSFTVSYDWSGTVTPSAVTGYTFSPASLSFTNVLADQTAQNFTYTAITYTISGALGTPGAGATLSYTDGTAKTATADGAGNYTFTVSYNWTGTVTPSAVTGYTFSPASLPFTNVTADQTAQNFTYTAITFTISGYAGISDGTLAYTDGTPKTAIIDGSGNYTFTVSYNWTGTVTPTRAGYTFFPAFNSYANVLTDQLTQNFTAELNPVSTITPAVSWTLPAAPYATVGKTYAASVPTQAGYTIAWTIVAGTGTINGAANTEAVSFTPTDVGPLQLQCVVSKASLPTSTGSYTVAVESVLTANPATITVGQGTILMPTFTGTGLINPGAIPVTSGTGLTVTPGTTTTYTLNVDAVDVATATVTVQTFAPKFVYVANYGDGSTTGSISAFSLNTGSGTLTPATVSPNGVYTVERVTTDPNGKFLFAAGRNNGVHVFSIDAITGALTQVSGSPFVTEPALLTTSVAVDPLSRFVYVNSDIGKIYAFTLNAVSGALTPVPGLPAIASNNYNGELLVHPSGKFLFAACSNTDFVEAFVIDPTSGALSPVAGTPFATGVSIFDTAPTPARLAGPSGLAMDPTGAYLIVKGDTLPNLSAVANKVAAFSVNPATGTLSPVTNSPFSLGILSSHVRQGLTFHPTKNVLFSTFFNFGTVDQSKDAGAFVLNGGTGTLTPTAESPYSFLTLYGSDCLAIDRSGQFAFAAIRDGSLIRQMKVDGTGVLKALDGITAIAPLTPGDPETTLVGANPSSIVVAGSLLP